MTDLNTLTIGPNPFSDLNVAYGISRTGSTSSATAPWPRRAMLGFLLTAAIPGDANGDGTVNINDLTIAGPTTARPARAGARATSSATGKVNINDLTIVLGPLRRHVGSAPPAACRRRPGTGGASCCWRAGRDWRRCWAAALRRRQRVGCKLVNDHKSPSIHLPRQRV